MTAGASYDHASNAPDQLTPRAAVIVKGSASATLKLLYGQAFRSPSVYELSYEGSGFLHAAALRPEKIRTLELVWEQRISPSVLVTGSVFDESLTDLVRLQPVSANEVQYQNRGSASSRGVALQVDARHNSGIWSYASYSWHRARELEERMVNSPLYLAKAGLSTPTSRRAYGGLELQYEGSRLTYAGQETGDRLLTNLNVGGRIAGAFGASVAVRNLFGLAYGTPGGSEHRQDILEQDGRTFLLSLKWTGR
jgi:iron complex outermembrane receptor protein